ncbi:MAG: phospholipase, partial [Paludibacteraceae bacterium]|nr:phospholipase [Paludibacteraceae bacterium]
MILAILIAILIILIIGVTIFVRRVNKVTPEQPPVEIADDCCGSHAVCERDSLLSQTDQIIYFDDEELDTLQGIPSEDYTEAQTTMLENVFYT